MYDQTSRMMEFLERQRNEPNLVLTIHPWNYAPDYVGPVLADILGFENVPHTLSGQQYIAEDRYYDWDYTGPMSGFWWGLDNPDDYEVRGRVLLDVWYDAGSWPLEADGTWTIPKVGVGYKVVELVRKSDGAVVDSARKYVNEFEVRLYTREDIEYEQVNYSRRIYSDYKLAGSVVTGEKVARIIHAATGKVVGTTDLQNPAWAGQALSSFAVPWDDPLYDVEIGGYRLQQRAWIYDQALAIFAYVANRRYDIARGILDRLATIQNPDGSLPFSFDRYMGLVAENYLRTGANAWVGWAACIYARESRDFSRMDLAESIASWILSMQVSDANDPRYGLCRIGRGRYLPDYTYIDEPQEGVGTEHNLDVYFFLRELYALTSDPTYRHAADQVRDGLLRKLYDEPNDRFFQGMAPDGTRDTAWALDCLTWAGLFLTAIGEWSRANRMADKAIEVFRVTVPGIFKNEDPSRYNMTYELNVPVTGFKPYADYGGQPYSGNPNDPAPEIVWSEGTWGAILLLLRLGRTSEANFYMEELRKIYNVPYTWGGFLYGTAAYLWIPWEFSVWPSVAGTAWGYVVLTRPDLFFGPETTHGLARVTRFDTGTQTALIVPAASRVS